MEEISAIKAHLIENLTTFDDITAVIEMPPSRAKLSDNEFARFFSHSLDLLCIASFNGYIKCVNPAWTRCLGWSREELEAKSFLELVHPDDYAYTEEEMAKLADGVETTLFENRYLHKSGSYRWLRWSVHPVPEYQRVYAIAQDISQEKRLEAEILEIADHEKKRLGRELHDGLCQTLAGIAALSATLAKSLRSDAESAAAEEISNLLKGAINEARHLAHGFGLLNMEARGIDGAFEKLALNVQQMFRISCSFKAEHQAKPFSNEIGMQLFRITQEAVNNALSHGRAGQIEIRLGLEQGKGLLCIRDDGIGLSKAAENPGGIGLQTMVYRARQIGASLEVRPRSKGGTVVRCVFPIHGINSLSTCEGTEHVA